MLFLRQLNCLHWIAYSRRFDWQFAAERRQRKSCQLTFRIDSSTGRQQRSAFMINKEPTVLISPRSLHCRQQAGGSTLQCFCLSDSFSVKIHAFFWTTWRSQSISFYPISHPSIYQSCNVLSALSLLNGFAGGIRWQKAGCPHHGCHGDGDAEVHRADGCFKTVKGGLGDRWEDKKSWVCNFSKWKILLYSMKAENTELHTQAKLYKYVLVSNRMVVHDE